MHISWLLCIDDSNQLQKDALIDCLDFIITQVVLNHDTLIPRPMHPASASRRAWQQGSLGEEDKMNC